jgi:hypothetical protein
MWRAAARAVMKRDLDDGREWDQKLVNWQIHRVQTVSVLCRAAAGRIDDDLNPAGLVDDAIEISADGVVVKSVHLGNL